MSYSDLYSADKSAISMTLYNELMKIGAVGLTDIMFRKFKTYSLHSLLSMCGISVCRKIFDANTLENFVDWIVKLQKGNRQGNLTRDDFEDFKTLLSSPDFMLLSFYLSDPVTHYEEWYGVIMNSKSRVLMDKNTISMALDKELMRIGVEGLIEKMFPFFLDESSGPTGHSPLGLRLCKIEGIFDNKTCRNFNHWFRDLDNYPWDEKDLAKDTFKILLSSCEFMLLCFYLYSPRFCSASDEAMSNPKKYDESFIWIKSFDSAFKIKMDKAAISHSEHLRYLIDRAAGNVGEIVVPEVSSSMLPDIMAFCKENHKFHKHLDSVAEHLKSILASYKDLLTGFLNNNQRFLSSVHKAAVNLNIPSLLELTSRAMGDMKEKTVEEISDWFGRLSILRKLSPLGIIGDAFTGLGA